MRPRYYCDHCNKGNGSPSAMKRHERGCTMNPQRVCGMCAKLHDEFGPEPAPSRDELRRVLDAEGFKAMCEAAKQCPACILSVVRTLNTTDDDTGLPCMLGPEDGRQEWSYRSAKEDWWRDFNDAAQEKNYPGY